MFIMIDKLFEAKKMVGGDEHTCSICLEDFTGNERRQDLVCFHYHYHYHDAILSLVLSSSSVKQTSPQQEVPLFLYFIDPSNPKVVFWECMIDGNIVQCSEFVNRTFH